MKKGFAVLMALTLALTVLPTMLVSADGGAQVYQNEELFLTETGAEAVDFPDDADTALPSQPWTFLDHSCTNNETGIQVGPVTVKAPAAKNWICYIGQDWDAGTNNTNPTPTSPTIIANAEDDYHVVEFPEPVYAVGFELLTNKNANETITLTYADGTTGVIGDSDLGTGPNTFEFVGFSSDNLIKSVAIDTTGGATQNEGISGIWVKMLGPITTNVVGMPNPAAVEAEVSLTANVDDSTTGGSNIASAEYSLDGVTWSPMNAADDSFDAVSEDVTASVTAPSTAGIYDLCVRGTDAVGNLGDSECAMLVVYDPDGGFVTGGGWIEASTDEVSAVWDQGFETDTAGWLDSDDEWCGMVTRVASGTDDVTSSAGDWHAIMEGDESSGPFSRFDGYRDQWPGTWVAEIDVYLDPSWAAGTGFDYSVAASGSDGHHQRDYIFHVTKDTSTGKLLVAGSNNTNSAPREDLESINSYEVTTAGWYTLQHLFYEKEGALAVDLSLLDAAGDVLFTETRFNAADVIPDEVGGNLYAWFTFINVGGGIAVDEHQLFMETSVTGKASFGFVSKYKKGADVPTGNTEFQFKAAGLNFHSTSYDWLVVTGSDYAKFKGSGTINGELAPNGEEYKFQLWAGDGDPDTFRIKIWWEEGETEHVVYDNGMDQEIGGGSIVVHAK